MDIPGLIVAHMPELNAAVSLSAASAGFVLYRYRPKLFDDHPFMRRAFWFLIGRWLCLVFIYSLLNFPPNDRLFLAFVDLQGVCDIGFAWFFVQGDESSTKPTLWSLFGVTLFLWFWNYYFYPGTSTGHDFAARAQWLAFSDAVSAFSTPLFGFAFLLRYRGVVSLLLFLISLGYSVCQRLITDAVANSPSVGAGLQTVSLFLFLLVIGKLLLGGVSYSFFFAPVSHYSVATTTVAPEVRAALWLSLKKGMMWLLLTLPIHILATVIVHYLLKYLHLL